MITALLTVALLGVCLVSAVYVGIRRELHAGDDDR